MELNGFIFESLEDMKLIRSRSLFLRYDIFCVSLFYILLILRRMLYAITLLVFFYLFSAGHLFSLHLSFTIPFFGSYLSPYHSNHDFFWRYRSWDEISLRPVDTCCDSNCIWNPEVFCQRMVLAVKMAAVLSMKTIQNIYFKEPGAAKASRSIAIALLANDCTPWSLFVEYFPVSSKIYTCV